MAYGIVLFLMVLSDIQSQYVLGCKVSIYPTQEAAKNIFLQSQIVF